MNEAFLQRMQSMLKEDYDAYLQTLNLPAYRGIRANLLKISAEKLAERNFTELKPSLFAPEGFYLEHDPQSLGNHIYHRQGLFYMQEPSASSAVTILDPQPGDWVLDLCAAPGGKSTQIASRIGHEGFLIANEIDGGRSRILMSNLERMGVSEALITHTSPDQFCPQLAGWMDKVLVDAPCSGEGMFKKEEMATVDWSEEHVKACSIRQRKILDSAFETLKDQGILVYSTCTYSMEENEETVADFLNRHPEMELIDCGVTFGRPGYSVEGLDGSKVRRIFPMDQGEGHFVAKMKKNSSTGTAKRKTVKPALLPDYVVKFLNDQLTDWSDMHFMMDQDRLMMMKHEFIQLNRIPVVRQGICVGQIVKNRLEPHHHFYISAMLTERMKRTADLNEEQLQKYCSGETVQTEGQKGYVCLMYQGYPVGFGKSDGLVIKNKYPKGLRIR